MHRRVKTIRGGGTSCESTTFDTSHAKRLLGYHGTMVPGYPGTRVPWCHGAVAKWCHGTTEPWSHGTMPLARTRSAIASKAFAALLGYCGTLCGSHHPCSRTKKHDVRDNWRSDALQPYAKQHSDHIACRASCGHISSRNLRNAPRFVHWWCNHRNTRDTLNYDRTCFTRREAV